MSDEPTSLLGPDEALDMLDEALDWMQELDTESESESDSESRS